MTAEPHAARERQPGRTWPPSRRTLDKPDLWEARMIGNSRRLPVVRVGALHRQNRVDPHERHGEDRLIDPYTDDPSGMLHPADAQQVADRPQAGHARPERARPGHRRRRLHHARRIHAARPTPTDTNSHPPYWTKLVLKRFVRMPFRLRFDARNGDTSRSTRSTWTQPTQFLKVGDMVTQGTKFKVTKFEAQGQDGQRHEAGCFRGDAGQHGDQRDRSCCPSSRRWIRRRPTRC